MISRQYGSFMLILWIVTIFLNAFLLFWLEPLAAKALLPHLGGGAAVWNACMMFYQVVLLLGYLYAARLLRLERRWQVTVHMTLIAVALAWLPLTLVRESFSGTGSPVWWTLTTLAAGIGVPFFMISSHGPLLQAWFAGTDHPRSADPYFFFAASNLGSLVALLGFPFFFEVFFTSSDQVRSWSLALLLLAVMLAACMFYFARHGENPPTTATAPASPPDSKTKLSWAFFAFVPSSLLLGVTSYISSDVGSLPLFWVIPLALYLLSFVVAFSGSVKLTAFTQKILAVRFFSDSVWSWVLPLAAVGGAVALGRLMTGSVFGLVAFHLVLFFVVATTLHIRLAEMRPQPEHLGSFYLWLGGGGAMGGVMNSLLAPLLLTRLHEYPLVLALAIMCRTPLNQVRLSARDVAVPLALATVIWLLATQAGTWISGALDTRMLLAVPAFCLIFMLDKPVRLAFCIIAILWGSTFFPTAAGHLLAIKRSFYGIHRIYRDDDGRHWLEHGITIHGGQALASDGAPVPLTYYHPDGPIGDVFLRSNTLPRPVGLIGLGTGAMAYYARPDDVWTFYEIDPAVAAIAADTSWFRFMAGKQISVKLGDGRLSVAALPAKSLGTLVIDAFGSDSIPVHLLTREAVQTYLEKISGDGVLLFHFSNRYLNLEPVLVRIAEELGLHVVSKIDQPDDTQKESGRYASHWVVVTRPGHTLLNELQHFGWTPADTAGGRIWTDDFSSILYLIDTIR